MPSARKYDQRLNKTLRHIIKERFVHSLSHLVYDKVATLYHIDKESEGLMSQIASNVVIGMFCLEYLSHINALIKKKAGLERETTALDLSDEDVISRIKSSLSNREIADIFKKTARILKRIMDSADIKTLEDLTKVAHTGDYLLSSLRDMKDLGYDEYSMWLHSIPYYYERDLKHLSIIKEREYSIYPDTYPSFFWNEQIPAEFFHFEKVSSDHRINLNVHLPAENPGDGYFPCSMPKGKVRLNYWRKERRAY
jgi:hypothetical protein